MRVRRMTLMFLAFYLVFVGGSAYYTLIFPVRLFHHGLMTVLIALWFWGRWRSGRGLPRTSLDRPLLVAALVAVASAIVSIDPRMAFENLWFAFIHVVFFYVLVDLFQRGRHRMVMEVQFILAALVVFITVLEVASWYFGLGIIPGTEIGWIDVIGARVWLPRELPRVSLAMNISTLLAGYVAPLVTLTLGWALTARLPEYRRVLRWLLVLLVIVLLLTASRGGMLSLAASLSVFVALQIARRNHIPSAISQHGLLALLGVAGVIGVVAFMLVSLSGGRTSGDRVRLDLYRSALEITADYPVLGVGPGLYGRALREYRSPELARDRMASAHNLYLHTASEAGIAGIGVALWLVWAFGRGVRLTWREARNDGQRIRIEAAVAALIGVGVHSLVDVFTTTPIILVILLLAAFALTGTRSVLDTPPSGRRWPCMIGLVVAVGYGIWFVQIDRAQISYQFSLVHAGTEESLELARSAAQIDPYLNLYDLHIAYLLGQGINDESNSQEIAEAAQAYERALSLEPTWDLGWMNLAMLELWQGNTDAALSYVERAFEINPLLQASWNWPRLQESAEVGESAAIIEQYLVAIRRMVVFRNYLPQSTVWQETVLRRAAFDAYVDDLPLDLQYRVLSVIDPTRAVLLVPSTAETAAEWWVMGEHALRTSGDMVTAVAHFTEAIALEPDYGDYYVSRARSLVDSDPSAAQYDLNMAYLLGIRYEQPSLIRAELTSDPDEVRRLRAQALPPRIVPQEFAAVLYGGRMAVFDLYPALRYPGPGRVMMQPWYTIADSYLAVEDIDAAMQVYEAILDYAPDETEARERIHALKRR